MSATVNKWLNNLPCTRFVRQVSNGTARSKYSFVAMMRSNAAALDSAPWRVAACPLEAVTNTVNKVTATDGDRDESGALVSAPSYSAYLDDRYDAYQQGGDADVTTATMCGYAGLVAYRFDVPSCVAGQSGDKFLQRLDLAISRDRYLRAGVRVMVSVNSQETPPDAPLADIFAGSATGFPADYKTTLVTPNPAVEGMEAVGEFAQADVDVLLNSRAGETTLALDLSTSTTMTVAAKYVWVFLALADYASYWPRYSATEPRYYSIEGSAMLVPSVTRFGFLDATTAADELPFVGEDWGHKGFSKPSLGEGVAYSGEVAYFGNLAAPGLACGIAVAEESSAHPLSAAFALVNRASPSTRYAFGETWGKAPSSLAECLEHADLRVFGNLPVSATNFNHNRGGPGLAVVLRNVTVNAEATAASSPFRAAQYSQLVYSGLAVSVPATNRSYTKIKLSTASQNVRYYGFRPRILVWRSSSPDLFSAFGMAALGTCTCNPDFVSGRSTTVSGSVTGDAEATGGISLSAKFDRVASFDLAGMADAYATNPPMEVVAALDSPVYPGEVIVLMPSVSEACPWPSDVEHWSNGGHELFGAWSADVDDARVSGIDAATLPGEIYSYAFTPNVSFA